MSVPIFTEFRRTLIAKTLFDCLKIELAGALASNFFIELPRLLRFALGLSIPVLLVAAILVCPRDGRKE